MQPAPQNAWHVMRGGQSYGPYTWEQIVEHAAGRRIGRADRIMDPHTGVWTKPTQVPGLFGPGGAAVRPVGLTMAAKVAVGIVIGLISLLTAILFIRVGPGWGPSAADWLAGGQEFVQEDRPTLSSTAAEVPPEGLAFKGTFRWQSKEGEGVPNLWHDDPCYLWIYTTDEGTAASFDFGEHLIDGWPVFLQSQSGSDYTFRSSTRSLVEEVKIVATVTDTGVTGTVTNDTPDISSFVDGTFTGSAITYEQYQADVID